MRMVLSLTDWQTVVTSVVGHVSTHWPTRLMTRFLQGVAAEGEEQQADAGPAIGCLLGRPASVRCPASASQPITEAA